MTKILIQISSDIVVDYLADFLKRASGGDIDCSVAPYDQVTQALLGAPVSDNLLLWTSPEKQVPSFGQALSFEKVDADVIAQEVAEYASYVRKAAGGYGNIFVMNWSLPVALPWAVGLMAKNGLGPVNLLARMNLQLAEALADLPNVHFVDLQGFETTFDGRSHDPRIQAMARMPYSPDFLEHVAATLAPALLALVVPSRKVIFCDLDNTMWGGIVGDDGIAGLKIGGNDPVGASHLQVQKILKGFNNRGILLALSSKNTESVAVDAIENHPNMILRMDDFSAKGINWQDKAANISAMLKELNLLPSAAVFLDDNVSERERVKGALPDVLVPDLPVDVAYWPQVIAGLTCFETLTISDEDLQRSQSYRTEKLRREDQEVSVDLGDWLNSLELAVEYAPVDRKNLARTVQLLNKTNQFNTQTRRFTEEAFWAWSQETDNHAFTYTVSDKYGTSGLTGVASLHKVDGAWEFADFVLSCRVMGKGVEDAIIAHAKSTVPGDAPVQFNFTETPKNLPARSFVERITKDGVVPTDFAAPSHIDLRAAE